MRPPSARKERSRLPCASCGVAPPRRLSIAANRICGGSWKNALASQDSMYDSTSFCLGDFWMRSLPCEGVLDAQMQKCL
eukprot:9470792-Pyramimonas_sp.AAC.1